MQNLFYGWLDTIIIPQIPAKEKEKTQRNIKKRGGHLWASTFLLERAKGSADAGELRPG